MLFLVRLVKGLIGDKVPADAEVIFTNSGSNCSTWYLLKHNLTLLVENLKI